MIIQDFLIQFFIGKKLKREWSISNQSILSRNFPLINTVDWKLKSPILNKSDKKFNKPEKSAPNGGVGKSAAVDQAIIDASVRVEQQRRLDHAAKVHRENLTKAGERLEEIEGNRG